MNFKKIKYIIRIILDKIIIFIALLTKTNLLVLGYKQNGIMNYSQKKDTGENFVIKTILKELLKNDELCFFDVGANKGDYSIQLRKYFPKAKIYAFEPNIAAYRKNIKEVKKNNILYINSGLGTDIGSGFMYDYKDNGGTEDCSIYKEVITELHNSKDYSEITFEKDTIDNFCLLNNINSIDFIKIDTEGSELNVLKGASKMLNKIKIIQFEFNEMNVISRVFLRDYYQILRDFDIYRIGLKGLIPLPKYKTENEVFKYQNLLAINKTII